MVEPLEQHVRRKEPQPRGRELERERQPVETPAQSLDGRRSLVGQLEGAAGRPCPLREQRDGRIDRERGKRVLPFGSDPERRPAGRHDPKIRAAVVESRDLGRGGDDLLEIVEQQQRLPVADQAGYSIFDSSSLGLLDVERFPERGQEVAGLGDVGHRHECDAVQELRCEHPAELHERAGLADPAGAGDRHDPVPAHELDERRQVCRAPDERCDHVGQVAGQARPPFALAFQRGRIGHHDTVGRHGVELERPPDVLEPELPERHNGDVAPVLNLCVRRIGQQNTSGCREGLHAGGDVDRLACQPLCLDDHLADMDPDSHGDVLRPELLLDRDRGEHRVERAREHAHAPVSEPLDDGPAEGVVVAVERGHIPVALADGQLLVRLDQGGVADHVGEHHGDEPTIEALAHPATLTRPNAVFLATGDGSQRTRTPGKLATPDTDPPLPRPDRPPRSERLPRSSRAARTSALAPPWPAGAGEGCTGWVT